MPKFQPPNDETDGRPPTPHPFAFDTDTDTAPDPDLASPLTLKTWIKTMILLTP
ncbi:MAG: hypothetical protein ACOX52_11195 [Verrucomicrobiota bacterium]